MPQPLGTSGCGSRQPSSPCPRLVGRHRRRFARRPLRRAARVRDRGSGTHHDGPRHGARSLGSSRPRRRGPDVPRVPERARVLHGGCSERRERRGDARRREGHRADRGDVRDRREHPSVRSVGRRWTVVLGCGRLRRQRPVPHGTSNPCNRGRASGAGHHRCSSRRFNSSSRPPGRFWSHRLPPLAQTGR